MRTEIKIPFGVYWKLVVRYRLKQQFRLLSGKIMKSLLNNMKEYETYVQWKRGVNKGPLTPEQIESLVKFQVEKVSGDRAKRSKNVITDDKFKKPVAMQHLGARLLFGVLEKYPVSSVINIGARVDLTSAYLAPKFPDIKFISMDFQPNLRWYNELLPISDNQEFISGYALDLLKNGLSADAVYMTSTSVLFNAKELEEYINNLNCKFLVLNEPWFPNFRSFVGIDKPENISTAYCSGAHFNYHHNYVKKLEEDGWTIDLSQIIPADDMLALQIVARKN